MEGWKLMNQLNSVVITWYIFVLISPYSQKGTDATTNLDEEGNCVNSANPNGRKARRRRKKGIPLPESGINPRELCSRSTGKARDLGSPVRPVSVPLRRRGRKFCQLLTSKFQYTSILIVSLYQFLSPSKLELAIFVTLGQNDAHRPPLRPVAGVA
ncbi:hypothetical protein Csa_020325 [Cucumis sativus]|uniref:Uncharacterized protein n=1 Tax=Cucumis sativus TaxID=3659 RepID=A0A0A0K670_CUCSA|nr:hypothetical protein Csa_020325 [Cucumis sativus]